MKSVLSIAIVICLVSTASAGFVATGGQMTRDQIHVYSPVGSYETYTGMFNFNISSGSLPNGATQYYAFCIDLSEYLANPDMYNIAPLEDLPTPEDQPWQPMGADRANLLRELFGRHYASLFDGADDARDQQAFQLCVWEIIYEVDTNGDPNFADVEAGDFRATGLATGVGATANSFLNTLTGSGPYANLLGLESTNQNPGYGQDFVTIIPLPGAAVLGILGIGIAGWMKRRINS